MDESPQNLQSCPDPNFITKVHPPPSHTSSLFLYIPLIIRQDVCRKTSFQQRLCTTPSLLGVRITGAFTLPIVLRDLCRPLLTSLCFQLTKVAILGAGGGIGQPLSLLMKLNPRVTELALYDIRGGPGLLIRSFKEHRTGR